jgi:hypothetical protein
VAELDLLFPSLCPDRLAGVSNLIFNGPYSDVFDSMYFFPHTLCTQRESKVRAISGTSELLSLERQDIRPTMEHRQSASQYEGLRARVVRLSGLGEEGRVIILARAI